MWWIFAKFVPWFLTDEQKQKTFLRAENTTLAPITITRLIWALEIPFCFPE